MTVFDELAETDGDNEFKEWLSKLIDAKQEIIAFVSSRLSKPSGTGEFSHYLKGSFNLSLVIKVPPVHDEDEQKVLVRFPKPGHTATNLRDEKVRNEVSVLELIREKTTIPVPAVLSWGTSEEGPAELGPFIIMELMPGVSLASLLKEPTEGEKDEVILATDVDDEKLDYVYEQLADYLLQLERLEFDKIGAIGKGSEGQWSVKARPLTYNMNELATVVSSYPTSTFPTTPFTSTRAYLIALADEHLVHLSTQRNIANTQEGAEKMFIARHQFRTLIDRFYSPGGEYDTGPFRLFCDDMQPTNMLADPETFKITAVLDWEFSNAMPAEFSWDPPAWLLLLGPDMWLERHSYEEFLGRYVPRMEHFLRALGRVEARSARLSWAKFQSSPRLSVRMRESWESGRFWFNYGVRKSWDVDAVYWAALHKEEGDHGLKEEMKEEMEKIVDMKMEQLKEYDEECRVRFG